MVVLFGNESGTAEDFTAFVSLIKRDKGFFIASGCDGGFSKKIRDEVDQVHDDVNP